jgi:hypothetical protein
MSSIIEQPTGTIVKSDHSGRTRYTAQYKQEVVAAFESSSLSAPAFARQSGSTSRAIRICLSPAWMTR